MAQFTLLLRPAIQDQLACRSARRGKERPCPITMGSQSSGHHVRFSIQLEQEPEQGLHSQLSRSEGGGFHFGAAAQ